MSRAEDECVRERQDGLDEDVELPAADQAVIVSRVLAEIEGEMFGFLAGDDLAGGVPNLSLDAPASDSADHGAIFADQDFGAFVAGNGPADIDDSREGALLADVAEAH